ncbi:coiled-coil domain-containing protein 160 homolog [Danio aesculapii]|uniref:coiled-coil domain-containing protein 160 homolog n=1 Tax=Danio aesculapii TaxID=1142201 RepID=UPI0024BF844E|nr:coiled-coil domain-containing protein 160 homolog [Danio aesculapii]
MEITEKITECESSSRDDHHWVEKLFPPRFTFQSLLESQTNTNEQDNSSMKPSSSSSSSSSSDSTDRAESQRSRRRQIYLRALKEVQHTERTLRTETLARRIIRHEQPEQEGANSDQTDIERCIWTERDISKLRSGLEEVEGDRWRIKQQLSYTEDQLKAEHEQRVKLQGLVEKLEEQLSLSKKRAARQALVINDLKSESQKMNAQLRKLTLEVREKEEEADRWKTILKQAKEDMQQSVQERSKLAWELEGVRAQWKCEGERMEKAAWIENEAVLLRLQKELEQARADMHAEKESHKRSLTALQILRKHYSNK